MHARFFLDQGALWVEDLGSSNGIYVGPQQGPARAGADRRDHPRRQPDDPAVARERHAAAADGAARHARASGSRSSARRASAVEDERDAFAQRVGELFEELKALRDAQDAHATGGAALRAELEQVQRQSAVELEQARLEAAKSREAKIVAETQAGITTAEQLAESDMLISGLQHELGQLKAAAIRSGDGGPGQARSRISSPR